MSSASGTKRRERGFTMIEVLVALSIIGLIATLLLSVLDMQGRSEVNLRKHTSGDDSVVTAQTALRGRLEAMRLVPDLRGTGNTLTMRGELQQIDFEAPIFASEGPHGLHRFRLVLGRDRALMLYSINIRSSANSLEFSRSWNGLRLLDNVEQFEITYFGPDRRSGRDVWQERWEYQSALPKLVRVRLSFAAGDTRFWPVLMVRIAPQQKLGCAPGEQSPECRGQP
jgi:general secretion pathway protein J